MNLIAFFTKFVSTCISLRSSPTSWSGRKFATLVILISLRSYSYRTECQEMKTLAASAVGVNIRHTMSNVVLGSNGFCTSENMPSFIYCRSSRSLTKLFMWSNWHRISSIWPIALSFFDPLTLESPLMKKLTRSTKKIIMFKGVSIEWLTIAVYFWACWAASSRSSLCFCRILSRNSYVISVRKTALLGRPL